MPESPEITPFSVVGAICEAYERGKETPCLSDDLSASRARQSEVGRLQYRIAEMECDHKACLAAVVHNAEVNIREAQEALAAEIAHSRARLNEIDDACNATGGLAQGQTLVEKIHEMRAEIERLNLHFVAAERVLRAEIERANTRADQAEAAADQARKAVCGVTHALLNDLSMVANLPGSPTYAACIGSIIEELPRLRADLETVTAEACRLHSDRNQLGDELKKAWQRMDTGGIVFTAANLADAALGRLVRGMPDGAVLHRLVTSGWKSKVCGGCTEFHADTPEAALRAVGIGTGDDDADGEKGRA